MVLFKPNDSPVLPSEEQPKEKENLRRRSHTSVACGNCRKVHHSCNSERPCPRCIWKGLEDSCKNDVQRKRGRKKPKTEEEVESKNKNGIQTNRAVNHAQDVDARKEKKFKWGNVIEVPILDDKHSFAPNNISNNQWITSSNAVTKFYPPQEANHSSNKAMEALNRSIAIRNHNNNGDIYNSFENVLSTYLNRTTGSMFQWMFIDPPRSPVPSDEGDIDRMTKAMAEFSLTVTDRHRQCIPYMRFIIALNLAPKHNLEIAERLIRATDKANKLYHSLTPHQRLRVEENFQEMIQIASRECSDDPVPALIWDVWGKTHYLNKAFIELCNFPGDSLPSDSLFMQLFRFNNDDYMNVIKYCEYASPEELELPLVVPALLHIWGQNFNYVLQSRIGPLGFEQYLEGSYFMDVKCNSFGFPCVYIINFVPSPSLSVGSSSSSS